MKEVWAEVQIEFSVAVSVPENASEQEIDDLVRAEVHRQAGPLSADITYYCISDE